MHKTTLIAILFCLGICATLPLYAQADTENILFEQNFSNPGFPTGWTTNDISGQDVLWSWCANPASGRQIVGCPAIWSGGNSNQIPFAATSANNGFMTLDSDAFLDIGQDHISQLTSPAFDFSTEDTVWVKFETHLGAFNTTPNSNAILRVSNNGGASWEIFNCFPEFPLGEPTLNNRWSPNPKTIYFNVSEVAAFQSSVIFQWQWKGREEYQWSIDDFQVSGSDPRPEVDLVLRKKSFLIPENAIIPGYEAAPISFGVKIANQGSQPQSEINLTIDIFNENNELVFTNNLIHDMLDVDEESDLLLFENTFTPPNTPAIYEGIYSITPANDPDATPGNNQQNFSFEVSESILAKERQVTPRENTAPLDNEWTPQEPHSWAWGNYFFLHNGQGQQATSATFSIGNAVILGGKSIGLTLYEWTDLDNNKMAEPSERNLVAFATYQINGSEPSDEFITVPLFPLGNTAELDNNQGYLLMLEYFADDPTDLFISYSNEQDYKTTMDYFDSTGEVRFASMLGIGDPNTATYSSLAFGFDRIPMVRLGTETIVGTQDILPITFRVNISPNPTAKNIEINFDFPETIPMVTINLYNQSGKLLSTQNLASVQNERKIIDASHLASGVYYVEIRTNMGNRTMRAIKVK